MERLRNSVTNYLFHPNLDRVSAYLMGGLDGLGICTTTMYITNQANSRILIAGLSGIVLGHIAGYLQGRKVNINNIKLANYRKELFNKNK